MRSPEARLVVLELTQPEALLAHMSRAKVGLALSWNVSRPGPRRAETRKQARLSQEKLAERAELHPGYISAVERGVKT